MAQFRSSAREGSFSDNQLNAPSATDKIQREAQRQLSGMDRAQAFQQKNQQIALQAQKQAQGLEKDFRNASRRVGKDNYEATAKYTKLAYENQLIKKQNEDKYAIDTFGALVNFSKTALDITTGIVKQNKEIQQKAINEISSRFQLSHKDAVAAKSVDSSISAQQWQETEAVQEYLRQGRSQEFINTMYQHLVKGGGYKNYINNSIVLDETGRANARVLIDGVNKDIEDGLAGDDILARMNATSAKQRGDLTLDGKNVATLIQTKSYNAHIDRARDRAETLVNKVKTDTLTLDTSIQRTNTVKDAFNTGGVAGAMGLLKTKSSAGAVDEVIDIILKQNLTADQLDTIKKNPIEINGQITTLEAFPEAYAEVERVEKELRAETLNQIALDKEVQQAEVDVAGAKFYDEKFADGVYTEVEYQEQIALMDTEYPNRDRSMDKVYKARTIDNVTKAFAKEKLDTYLNNGTLSESLMDEMLLPKQLDDQYRNNARRLDQVRSTGEFKGARKYFRDRFIGVIGQTDKLVMIDGGKQSDQVEWYANAKVNRAVKDYQAAVLAGVENPLEVVGNNFADKIATELEKPGFVKDFTIIPYQETMREGSPSALKAQKMVTKLAGKTSEEKSNPNTWVEIVGTKGLQSASKELAEKGNSEVLRILGSNSHPPLTAYEVQEKIAEVNPDIEAVEVPTYMELYKALPATIKNVLAGNTATQEAKLRAAREAMQIYGQQTQQPPVRSTFEQDSPIINITPAEGGLKGLTQQDYEELAYASSGEAFRGDMSDVYGVVASIINRKAQGYGGSNNIYDIVRQPNQYAAVVTDKTARYEPDLAQHLASPEGQRGIRGALEILQGRSSFKGVSQHHNMGPTDPGFHPKGNRYHYAGQTVGGGAYTGPIDRSYEQFYE